MESRSIHVAIIMDGNGRWATARGLPRVAGHRAGVEAVQCTVEAAARLGVKMLSLYAFSSDNWKRPAPEVRALMGLFGRLLGEEVERCRANGIRLSVIGRRDRLAASLRQAIERAEAATAGGTRLHLRLAVDYSSRDAILEAARSMARAGCFDRTALVRGLGAAYHAAEPAPDVDLLIRTGGEQRLSDFLLWECAYAELYFTETMWPDFDAAHLEEALNAFHRRVRRFGGLPEIETVSMRA